MTLIVGLRCGDGSVLIGADREESDQVAKRSVDKLFRIRLKQGMFLVGGAGRSSILANAFMRLDAALKAADEKEDDPFLDSHRDVIETVLYQIYESYIWGRHDENERGVQLVVAGAFRVPQSAPFLYLADADVLYPQQLYACAGSGQDLAYYLVDKLFHQHLSREVAALLAAFVFREVGGSVGGVGLGMDMFLLGPEGQSLYSIPHQKVPELEKAVPDLADTIANAWNSDDIVIPTWLTDLFKK